MNFIRLTIYIAIVALSVLVGSLFNLSYNIGSKSWNETAEYQFAKRLNGGYFGTCYQFKQFWQSVFPEKKCERVKTIKNFYHWQCQVINNLWIDANWKLDGKIRLFKK